MIKIIRISIRLFLLLLVFNFINTFAFHAMSLFNLSEILTRPEWLRAYYPFITLWFIYLAIIIILWVKAENIAKIIVGENDFDNIQLNLNHKSILSIGIYLLCIFFIINTSPRIFSYISTWVIMRTRFVDDQFLVNYTIGQIVDIMGIVLKLILSIYGIKHNKKIVELLTKNE